MTVTQAGFCHLGLVVQLAGLMKDSLACFTKAIHWGHLG